MHCIQSGNLLAWIWAVLALLDLTSGCDFAIRNRYCNNDDGDSNYLELDDRIRAACRACAIGPTCPVIGPRLSLQSGGDGLLLLRGIQDAPTQDTLMRMLDGKRLAGDAFTSCVPLLQWDQELAEIAQAWADQCALVEYETNAKQPKRLYHDPSVQRARSMRSRRGEDPGIGQSVHWSRSGDFDLTAGNLEQLVNSDMSIEDGLIDGLIATVENNLITWGQASHVGCGWVQFPSNMTGEFENFMVCNYRIGTVGKTSCSDNATSSALGDATTTSYITYYAAPSQIIEDVKSCLNAMRCRQRQLNFDQRQAPDCTGKVEACLEAKSGLKFLKASKLRSVARSGSSPIDVEASKCKIDTILCSLNSSFACDERLRRCLPLLDVLNGIEDDNRRPLAECRCIPDLVLSDGSRNDCTEVDTATGRKFCYVTESPCVTVGKAATVEVSKPSQKLNSLLHYSFELCNQDQ